jgi:hypothetical protein
MTSIVEKSPLFELSADILVEASPEEVYNVVSGLPRSGEWSPECQGGERICGEPATVGAVFRGENLRSEDLVMLSHAGRRDSTRSSLISTSRNACC